VQVSCKSAKQSTSCNKDAEKMSPLENYRTSKELAADLKQKTGHGCERTLQIWRAKRNGPPWVKVGGSVLYPMDGFNEWLKSQVQQPARTPAPRKRAVERSQHSTA
jgi:hypothetical protein